ncbi:MAG: hypothetical protein KM310_11745 [Clostridiales bacterium]|nr:hypothetical protein [Clostridiales bacterium]
MFDVKALYEELRSIRAVARITGHDRKTVRKIIYAQELPRYKPRPPRPSKLDPFKPYLLKRISEGVLNGSVLYAEIQAQGYTGGKTLVKDFVAPFRGVRAPKAVQRFETPPGQQAQVDWVLPI